jgi:hypothetical protein
MELWNLLNGLLKFETIIQCLSNVNLEGSYYINIKFNIKILHMIYTSLRIVSDHFLTFLKHVLSIFIGRAIVQAVSHWLPTAAALVRARVWSSGICGGQSGAGAGFLRVLRFPLPIFIPPNSPSSQSPGEGTIGQ